MYRDRLYGLYPFSFAKQIGFQTNKMGWWHVEAPADRLYAVPFIRPQHQRCRHDSVKITRIDYSS
jgi:hypothetical protein